MTIKAHGKPITFADFAAQRHRSGDWLSVFFRRAVAAPCPAWLGSGEKVIMALGKGGRAAPHWYVIDPMIAAMCGDRETFEAPCRAIEESK